MSHQAILIEVSGKVQGVFFRVSTQEMCKQLGILGWVKNLPDGNVMLHAQGSKSQLDQLKDWCKMGSPQSQVRSINVEIVEPIVIDRFEIRK